MLERRISSCLGALLHLRQVPTVSSCETHTVRAHIYIVLPNVLICVCVCVCTCADNPSITGPDQVFSAHGEDDGIELGADDGKPVSLFQ